MSLKNGNIIKKHVKNDNFTIIDNTIFRNKELSLKGKGLLTTLLSLPDNWTFSERGLTSLSKDGRDSLRSGLEELEEQGYLVRHIGRNDKGQFTNTIYNVYEIPTKDKPRLENPTLDNPTAYKELSNKELIDKELNNNKEINKERLPYQEIIDYLNLRTNKRFRVTADVRSKVNARYDEGFTLQDFKDVIDKKCVEWMNDTKMKKYLQPSTLFGTKFQNYLNQDVIKSKSSNPYMDMQFDEEGNLI